MALRRREEDLPLLGRPLGAPVDAVYDSTETLEGLETYKYHVVIDEEPTEVVDGVEGVYTQDKYLWIDPTTGSIIKQTQQELRALEDGSTLLDLDLGFTDEQVSDNVESAKDSGGTIELITRTVPLVGFIGGGLALLAGAFLVFAGRKDETA